MNTNKMNRKTKWFQSDFDFDCKIINKKPRVESTLEDNTNNQVSNETNDTNKEVTSPSNIYSDKEVLSENWIDRFNPKEVGDLAVNSKKVQEIQEWLVKALNNSSRAGSMLLLSGPSGSGKTITVQLLAKKLGLQVSEWVIPMDIEYVREYGSNSFSFQEKQADKFCNFLMRASCYSSLLRSSDTRRVVLVEDFPNTFYRDPSELMKVLEKYQHRGKSPLIFICTDARDGGLNIMWNLFPPSIQEQFLIDHISLNPVATTAMKSALKRITSIMGKKYNSLYKIPDMECIESIVNSSMGDVRSAVNNLHFASLKGTKALKIKNKVTQKKGKKGKKDENHRKLSSIGKDETLSIMHGVGRVLNPKFLDKTSPDKHQTFSHTPESIVNYFVMQPNSFVGYIHENYLPHFSSIDDVERATDALSNADCFMNEWREKDGKLYGLHVAVAGLMVANKAPLSSWHPIKGAKNMKIQYPTVKEIPLIEANQLVQGKILATDFKTYCQIINKDGPNTSLIQEDEILITE